MHSSPANPLDDPPFALREQLAGRYRLERALGAGGMATVYLSQGLMHDRKVALKVMKPLLRKGPRELALVEVV